MKKIAVFVDVQNIYYTTRDTFKRQFNYKALWQTIETQGSIELANAYAIERNDSKQKGFQNALRDIGFDIKLKPFIQRADGSAKGDWDVGIAIDVIEAAPDVDHIILLSGDGDFDRLLQYVNTKYTVSTQVFGVASLTAASLIKAADTFTPINEDFLL